MKQNEKYDKFWFDLLGKLEGDEESKKYLAAILKSVVERLDNLPMYSDNPILEITEEDDSTEE